MAKCKQLGRCHWHIGLLAVLAGVFIAAHAETDTDERLPEIIVTAQKVEQTLEQTPASVSTLSGSFLRDTNSSSFLDLQNYTGNVTISLTPDSGQFSIRGFGTPDSNSGFDPSVGTVIDGVYYGRSQFLSAFFFDIADFEVLRGPQGTLFGKNTSAGLFDVKTAAPQSTLLFRSELLLTDYGDRQFRPVVQVPLGDDLAIRVSANLEHGDRGVLHNTFLQRPERNPSQNSVRVRVRYTPSEAWLVDLEGFVSTSHENNNIFQLSRVTPAMAALVRSYDPHAEFSAKNDLNSANIESQNVDDIRGVTANVQYDFIPPGGDSQLSVHSITGLAQARADALDIDADFSPIPFIHDSLAHPTPYRQFSQELRFNGSSPTLFGFGHELTYVTGLYYSRSTLNTSNNFEIQDLGAAASYLIAADAGPLGNPLLPGSSIGGIAGQLHGPLDGVIGLLSPILSPLIGQQQSAAVLLDQQTEDYAVFGQFEHHILEHWSLIAGLRLGLEHKHGDASSQSQGLLVPLISDQKDFTASVGRVERSFSPKGGIQWSPDEHTSAYFTWTRGFKSGGFNALPLNADNLQYQPERASSFELGAKTLTEVWDTPVRATAALFWTDFVNLQVSTLQNASFKILNAGAARSRGFDADINWLPLPHTSLYLSAGFADAIYTHYPGAPAPADASNPTQDLTGRRLAFAPRWSLAFIPGYTVLLPCTAKAHLFLDVLYRSSRFLDIDDDPRKLQTATTQFNLRMTLNDASQLWSLSLALQNLSNVVVLDQVVNQPLAPGNFAAVRNDHGRFLSADLAFSFR